MRMKLINCNQKVQVISKDESNDDRKGQDSVLKIKLNNLDIQQKINEKQEIKKKQILQFQMMQQSYLKTLDIDLIQDEKNIHKIIIKKQESFRKYTEVKNSLQPEEQQKQITEQTNQMLNSQSKQQIKKSKFESNGEKRVITLVKPFKKNVRNESDHSDNIKSVSSIQLTSTIDILNPESKLGKNKEEPDLKKKVKSIEGNLLKIKTDSETFKNSAPLQQQFEIPVNFQKDNQELTQQLLQTIKKSKDYEDTMNFFKDTFFKNTYYEESTIRTYLDDKILNFKNISEGIINQREGFEQMEIVNNYNEKIKIQVPQRPLNYNWEKLLQTRRLLNKKDEIHVPKMEYFSMLIENSLDSVSRELNFSQANFRMNYQSGYVPVAMQQREEAMQQKVKDKRQLQKHFIRQKQSQANIGLKRSCGVSYVKPSESEQKNVSHIFKPLPPIMFQCSSGYKKLDGMDDEFELLFKNIFMGSTPLICTLMFDENESQVRQYLLEPQRRLEFTSYKLYYIQSITDLWMIAQDSLAVFIHLNFDQNTLIEQIKLIQNKNILEMIPQFIIQSEVIILVQFKRGLSGRKSFLKSIGLMDLFDTKPVTSEEQTPSPILTRKVEPSQRLAVQLKKEEGHINLYTCSIRMEMIVDEQMWHKSSENVKNMLTGFIQYTEQKLQQDYLIKMMNKRLKAFEKGAEYLDRKMGKRIRYSQIPEIVQIFEKSNQDWILNLENLQENLQKQKLQNSNYSREAIRNVSQPLQINIFKQLSNKGNFKETSYLESPLYCISTRDSFAFDLIKKSQIVQIMGRFVKKTEYFFDPKNCPNNFITNFLPIFPDYRVGVITYDDFFTHQELLNIESNIFDMEIKAFNGGFLPETAQISVNSTNAQVTSVKRTKFFFGYRYMWTKCQLAEPHSMVAAGVRKDVSQTPSWFTELIVNPLEKAGILPQNFINSIACNVYHDGKEGLAQHFDDAVRFRQPIFTLRTFSDCRLCFGSQFYGFCNGAFVVPLPRGCIVEMEERSYAANGIKHCVRPCDMTGKSCAIIMRQMHHQVTSEAEKFDEKVDLPCYFSTLSISDNAIPYGDQKRIEADILLSQK